jgi:hypothetical protein
MIVLLYITTTQGTCRLFQPSRPDVSADHRLSGDSRRGNLGDPQIASLHIRNGGCILFVIRSSRMRHEVVEATSIRPQSASHKIRKPEKHGSVKCAARLICPGISCDE